MTDNVKAATVGALAATVPVVALSLAVGTAITDVFTPYFTVIPLFGAGAGLLVAAGRRWTAAATAVTFGYGFVFVYVPWKADPINGIILLVAVVTVLVGANVFVVEWLFEEGRWYQPGSRRDTAAVAALGGLLYPIAVGLPMLAFNDDGLDGLRPSELLQTVTETLPYYSQTPLELLLDPGFMYLAVGVAAVGAVGAVVTYRSRTISPPILLAVPVLVPLLAAVGVSIVDPMTNPGLIDALEALGGFTVLLTIFVWELPLLLLPTSAHIEHEWRTDGVQTDRPVTAEAEQHAASIVGDPDDADRPTSPVEEDTDAWGGDS